MPRDYAKSQHKESRPLPGWLWLLAGLIIGLFVALLVYIKENSSGKITLPDTVSKVFQTENDTRAVRQEKAEPPPAKPVDNKDKEITKPRFDFYTILPELEVAIPEQELVDKRDLKNTATTEQGDYVLQVGSFRQYPEADRLKARLALQGIQAQIQQVRINDNDTWHRVRIGPIASIDTLNNTRKRLRDLGIASIVVKDKK